MKFKSIFWLFNGVVVLALVIFGVASFLLFGRDYAAVYWGNMWIVAVLFVVLIAVLDFYFVRNWKLFDLLEQEDWPALLAWLEDRIYVRGQFKRPYANLLINTALSVSNIDAVKKLETEVRQRKPELLKHLGVALGIPVLLSQDSEAVKAYFGPLADDARTHRRDWARWCRAAAAGSDGLEELADLLEAKDLSVRLLAYDELNRGPHELPEAVSASMNDAASELKGQLEGESGERRLTRSREDHLMAVVLTARVNEARKDLLADTV